MNEWPSWEIPPKPEKNHICVDRSNLQFRFDARRQRCVSLCSFSLLLDHSNQTKELSMTGIDISGTQCLRAQHSDEHSWKLLEAVTFSHNNRRCPTSSETQSTGIYS